MSVANHRLFVLSFERSENMPLSRQQKEQIIKELINQFDRMKTAIFVDYRRIPAVELEKLKRDLEREGVNFKVTKKTLLKIALQKSGLKNINIDNIDTPIATIFGFDDEIKPTKIIFQFAKEHENLKIIGGIFENKLIDEYMIKTLAALPTKN
jgi:large subunit ribosomal protein L10